MMRTKGEKYMKKFLFIHGPRECMVYVRNIGMQSKNRTTKVEDIQTDEVFCFEKSPVPNEKVYFCNLCICVCVYVVQDDEKQMEFFTMENIPETKRNRQLQLPQLSWQLKLNLNSE